jgi:hypothetical protein
MSTAIEIVCGYTRGVVNGRAHALVIHDRLEHRAQACGGES